MAADSVLPLQVVPASTAPVSRGSASGAPAAAGSTFPAASSSAARGGGPAAPAPSARRAAQSSADGSPAAAASGPASSDSNSSNASRKTASSASDASDSDSRSGGRTARSAKQGSRASGAPSSSSTTATQPPAPGTGNFSAALAQSLAAAPAEQSALTGGTADKGAAKADTSEPTEAPAKHSAADPVASALALLEHALASALMGVPLAAPATTAAAAAAASAGTTSSPSTDATATGNGGAIALDTLLAQSLGADLKAGGSSTLTSGGASSSSAAATSSSAAATSSSAAASATAGPAVSTAGVASAGVASAALAAVQLQGTAHVATQQAKSDATMSLSSPVGSSGWADELGTKVTWMAHQGIESASLQLSPEHLGPLQVTISVHDGQASVWFGAAQSDTRTALQQSLPQLRQLFASQGLTLADAGVSREPPRGQGRQSPSRAPGAVSGVAAVNLDGATSRTSAAGGLGLVDTYV